MTARFGVLGPLQVTGHDGRWLRLRGQRQRALLAMLLFNANERVPTDRLVDALWPGVPPKSYASNLHTYVSRLRDRLGDTLIDHAGPGYRLRVDDADLDLLTFRTAGESGRAALAAGDAETAAGHLRRALAQWRDRPLADLALPALDAEVARLEIERLTVFEDWVAAELAVGRHAALLGELQAAVAEHPLRERLVGQLMRALRRSGRQADALAAYRTARATLVEETGLEPGAELRAVHAEILRGDDDPADDPADEWPIRQLPADLRVFTGRDHAVDELTALLTGPDGLPVVLTGEPGVGKSALAVRVAHRLRPAFPDGQLYAHLAGATAPRPVDDVLTDLLRSLGVTGPGIPDDVHAKAAVLRSRLADRRVLLVLDDAADPGQVRPLLPGTPSTAVLVTSRRRLSGLLNAHRVTVGSLTDAEALDLLATIAGPRVPADQDGARRIAAACGNLPLALRIAGTRLALRPQLRLSTLADRLEDERRRLDELSVSDLQVRAGLALSYAALTEPARATFRLIGAAATTNVPAWAITVLQDGVAGEDAVDELVESSLLQPAADDACGEPRYEIHDLVLTFARERLLADDGAAGCDRAAARLLDAILALADRLGQDLPRVFPALAVDEPVPAPQLPEESLVRYAADPVGWFAIERTSLVAGIGLLTGIGMHRRAARIFERLARYLWPQGSYADLRACASALAEAGRAAGDERVEVWAEAVHARVLHVRGRYADAVEKYRWCADRLGADRHALAWVLTNLADCLTGLGMPEEALGLTDRAAALSTEEAVAAARSAALNRLGRPAESVRVDTEALAVARRSAEPRAVAGALQSLSWSLALTGELDRAATAAREAVALLRGTTARRALARALRTLGAVQAGRGERAGALAAFAECRAIAEEINEAPRVLSSRRAIAAGWVGDGRAGEAVAELRACVAAYREMGSASSTAITLRLLAAAHDAVGEPDAAEKARAEADLTADPRDSNARALTALLMNLTRVPGPSLSAH
ncbi:AfsR/SARP family transcriptional regulator [Actinophytocola glycyrrhizae]|uniref:BTAD domain-containing putative transcriptional regulator n=1 Tax=Actinophytocola glycyrrhizae TaxID=2044873 RepID=A0ABV9S4G7_9PSEU